jgi:hypothetical protein
MTFDLINKSVIGNEVKNIVKKVSSTPRLSVGLIDMLMEEFNN